MVELQIIIKFVIRIKKIKIYGKNKRCYSGG